MKYLAPSILSADFLNLQKDINLLEKAKADFIHCDIMDGQFVPNITFGHSLVKKINEITSLPLDVHLMIKQPENFIDLFADAGAKFISIHAEGNNHLDRLINQIKKHNIKAGIVLNPATPVNFIKDLLFIVDFVLVMSVNPGFGGQSFIDYTKNKIVELAKIKDSIENKFLIEIDGGVSLDNVKELADLGVDIFVAGSSVFNSKDVITTIAKFKDILKD